MIADATVPVLACCATLYRSPLAELLVGDSFHPGGREGTRELLAAARLAPGSRLLDVGAGLGASARLAADEFSLRVDAVDVSGSIVERGRARAADARVRWTTAALPRLPFGDGEFDAVMAECVLSTLDRSAALAEIRRVLRPDGILLLSDVENHGTDVGSWLGPVLGSALCLTDAWRGGEMDRLLDEAGFRQSRRWHRSSDIVRLIDRIEGRLGVVGLAARDLGLDLASLVGPVIGAGWALHGAELRAEAQAVRDAVLAGRLRYVALIAVRTLEATG